MSGSESAALLQAALAYQARGWSVLPLWPGSKRPLVAWRELQAARPTAEAVRGWWRRWPDANVGIVTGAVSGLAVLDVDPDHGGTQSLATREARHGPLPATVEAVSGGGGRHFYFRSPGRPVASRAALAAGIDLRGDGGVIVAPPSRHPSGRIYAWRAGRSPEETGLAPLPDWILGEGSPTQGRPGHPLRYWRKLLAEGVPEGMRNDTVASLCGHLLRHGVDPEVATELLLCWNRERCRPPLSDEEVVRTVRSITRRHERREEG